MKDSWCVGLVMLELDTPVVCLFKSNHFIKRRGMPENLSQWITEGSRVRVNAIKVHNHNIVGFMATSIWFEGEDYARVNMDSVYKPINAEDFETYQRLASSLTWDIKKEVKKMNVANLI